MTTRRGWIAGGLALVAAGAFVFAGDLSAQDSGEKPAGGSPDSGKTDDEKAAEKKVAPSKLPPLARRAHARRQVRKKFGGRKTQTAVDLALEWLKNHQSLDGSWGAADFHARCRLNKCSGSGHAAYDAGLTGGALLCFLGTGETHETGAYKDVVDNGMRYLRSIQDSEGCFGPRKDKSYQYNHALCSLAMVEAYGMTGSRLFKDAAQRGVNFVQKSQNPYLAWRYGIRDGDNDTSVTAWMVQVLHAAELADLDTDSTAYKGAVAWVDKMTEPEWGRVGYQTRGGQPSREAKTHERFPADRSESMTGAGVLVRVFAGENPKKSEYIRKGANVISKKPPEWDLDSGGIDFYHWYYGTMALHQVGGAHWKAWDKARKGVIVVNQRTEKGRDERGSWDPVDAWSDFGGRIYATVMNTLCLEAEYRYPRVFTR